MEQVDLRVKIETDSIRQRTFDSLFKGILNGYFKPGERLVERELCEVTGVSRSSVREALRQLEAEGLVEIVPNRGPIVATMDADTAREIYELREAIEAKAAGLFVKRATEAEIADVLQCLTHSIDAALRRDTQEMMDASAEFSRLLFEGCGNATFESLYRSMSARLTFLRSATAHNMSDDDLEIVVKHLSSIREAIKRMDVQAAEAACIERVRHAGTLAVSRMAGNKGL